MTFSSLCSRGLNNSFSQVSLAGWLSGLSCFCGPNDPCFNSGNGRLINETLSTLDSAASTTAPGTAGTCGLAPPHARSSAHSILGQNQPSVMGQRTVARHPFWLPPFPLFCGDAHLPASPSRLVLAFALNLIIERLLRHRLTDPPTPRIEALQHASSHSAGCFSMPRSCAARRLFISFPARSSLLLAPGHEAAAASLTLRQTEGCSTSPGIASSIESIFLRRRLRTTLYLFDEIPKFRYRYHLIQL
ncbi:hypothetical protein HPP92_028922 [Vanilla planifolia]|uniref:Uncharacterized protein n=1 Tax=Vanilla planifolia TaxID=51239 RepID=A0A835U3C3_VANPL|nr:hypothetical protein HPP92_028912 [Vanilla planifolia]KAG0446275.1 hypothetical protein HPP92_028922 [Vanilla planifolia]